MSPEPNEDVIIISMCGHDNRLGEKLTFFKQEPEPHNELKCFLKKPLACVFTLETFQFFILQLSENYMYKKDTEKPVELDVER